MSRATGPDRGSADPGVGLRMLARLVEDALLSMVLQPALATVGPTGPVAAEMAVDVSAAHHAGRRGALSDRTRKRPSGLPKDTDEIDEEHTEVWRLVSLAQAGDGEAFGQLYDRYIDSVYRFIYYRVNDRALAEDFTSETFLRALRRIGTITYQGRDIGAWFITIARNIVLDHLKSARHRLEMTTADIIEPKEVERSTEATVLDTLQSERLMEAVNKLGDEQRECVMLRFMQGLSVAETATVMGRNDGAIKALQHRAVRKLADLVGNDVR